MATSERLKMAFNSDQIRFRDNYLDSYEDHWYNVSTLKLEAYQCDFKEPIDNINQNFLSLDQGLKEFLKPFKIKETIEDLKRKYIPYVTIERIGDKDTWDKISQSLEAKLYMDSRINNASIIVCMVEVVYDERIVCVSKPSLCLLKKCLSEQPQNTEIVIITEPGIHASESKRIVYETLEGENIELPKAVHHAAETDIHDIVLGRVNLLIEDICKIGTTIGKSLPESSHTEEFVNESFEEHVNEQNIATVSKHIELKDGDSYIGKTSDDPLYYYNEYKIRNIREQLIKKCSECVEDQFKNGIETKINQHVVNRLQLSDEIPTLNQDPGFTIDPQLKMLALPLGFIFSSLLAAIVAPFVMLGRGIYVFASAVYRIFRPINVNDPSWRIECVSVLVTNFQEKKTEIISSTSSSLNETFTKMTRGLERLKLQNLDSFYYQHYYDKRYRLYSESTFHDHQRIRDECNAVLERIEQEQQVMKIVIGHDLSVTIYTAERTESTIQSSSKITLQQITKTTYEDMCIQTYYIEKKPTISSKRRHEIIKVISKVNKRFFTMHSNLSVIEPSAVKSTFGGRNIKECPCIVFVCIGKGTIPIGEPYFPKQIDGIEIDVREGFYIPLTCLSCSVGMDGEMTSGSFGFLVNKTGHVTKEGIITAAHVVVNKSVLREISLLELQKQYVLRNKPILFSPSNYDSINPKEERMYGFVADIHCGEWLNGESKYGIDAAFVEKLERSPVTLKFHFNSGKLSDPIIKITNLNKIVEKCGRTTGQTTGMITESGCSFKWTISDSFYILFENQYKIIPNKDTNMPFADFGDSGSGVYLVEKGNYYPIGIVDGKDKDSVYVTHIKYILKALDLEMFPVGMECDFDWPNLRDTNEMMDLT